MTSRIPIPEPDALDSDQQAVFDAIKSGKRGTVPTLFLTLMHNAGLADRIQKLGLLLRYETSFEASLSELAILAVARSWTCQYEWAIHEQEARTAGISEAIIEAIKHRKSPAFETERETIVYDFSSELQTNRKVSDETYDRAVALFGAPGVVELTALNGYYAMLAMTLNEHRVPLPGGMDAPLPA